MLICIFDTDNRELLGHSNSGVDAIYVRAVYKLLKALLETKIYLLIYKFDGSESQASIS